MSKHHLTRRDFIRLTGITAAAGVAATAATISAAASSHPTSAVLPSTIGVILPESRHYPAMGRSLIAGMRQFLDTHGGQNVSLITTAGGSIYRQAAALLREEGVQLVVGLLNSTTASGLRHLFAEHDATLIAANVGENMIDPTQVSAHVYHHTLNLWQSNWAAGNWAVRRYGKRGFSVASLADSGFDAVYAFEKGVQDGGGYMIERRTTHIGPTAAAIDTALAAIRAAQPDYVFASFYGEQGHEFLRAYAASGLTTPLIGSAFLVDEAVLGRHGRAALGLVSAFSWAPELTANDILSGEIDAFTVLGYETAQLIAAAGGSREALAAAAFAGLRGTIQMDALTHSTISPLYLREVRHGFALSNTIVEPLTAPPHAAICNCAIAASLKTGWSQPYLCV